MAKQSVLERGELCKIVAIVAEIMLLEGGLHDSTKHIH